MQDQNTAVEVRVPGSSLPLYTDGKKLVALKPITEYFGLDWAGQFTKLKSKSWATIGKFSTVAADGKTREVTAGDRRTLTMWLATLDENRVAEDKRDELRVYQAEAADALDAYFHEGAVINPRVAEHQINAVIFHARARMELCQAAQGLIHPDHLEARARIVLAEGLGEHAELDADRRPLYAHTFLDEKGLKEKKRRSVAAMFGKRVKKAYVEEHGVAPEQYPLNLSNGQIRNVNAYTEADRPLLESVWREYYAEPQLEVGA
ncbi:phage antirepressor N-terminal domain-containing protein [Gordonia malaquae]|uniref:phage antirepressor N-terminal domain-containing protein n=1 Tax=Gordonia malaquae TaxID=410332 RepID=UPI0030FEAA6B